MNERYRREWHDPTAIKAVRLAGRGRHSSRNSSFSPQAEIDTRIHTLRQLLAGRVISNADYRARIDPLRASLRQIRKGGRIK